MRFPRHARMFTGQLDVASFVSVAFLLLIFLVLHSAIAPPPGVSVQLPALESPSPPSGGDWLVVTVDRDGQFYYDHQVVTDERLGAELRRKAAGRTAPLTLLVLADADVRHGRLAQLYELARKAGVNEVKLGTRPPLFEPQPKSSAP